MKKIYYFGCSFTAGDELSDDKFFPELSSCSTGEEYYEERHRLISLPDRGILEYELENKKLAYPNLIYKLSDRFYKPINLARNGISWEENITDILETIISNKHPDGIVLQLGPVDREMLIIGSKKVTLRVSALTERTKFESQNIGRQLEKEDLLKYMAYKSLVDIEQHNNIHRFLQNVVMLKNFVESRNIFFFMLVPDWVVHVVKEAGLVLPATKTLLKEFNKTIYIPQPDDGIKYTIGGHWDKGSHEIIAEYIHDKLNSHFHK